MAAWLLTISKEFPQHWEYAQRVGFWDMVTGRSIEAGDVVYFWQSGRSLLGKVRTTEDAWSIENPAAVEAGPWDDWPGPVDKPYIVRFHLEVLAPDAQEQPTWSELQEATGLRQTPSWVRTLTAAQQRVLDGFIGGEVAPRQTLDDAQREAILANLDDDRRVQRFQMVDLRQGQSIFRNALIRAYGGRCAISGTSVEDVLEAAHISGYKGVHTNVVSNGLLLRADLHTLFDLLLLTIQADSLEVRIAPALAETEYGQLDRSALALTSTLDERPDLDALRRHNAECPWLGS